MFMESERTKGGITMNDFSKSKLLGDVAQLLYRDEKIYNLTDYEIVQALEHLLDKWEKILNKENYKGEIF